MMTEPVLALWIAAALFAAMAVGWLLAGFWRWLCLGTHCERARIAELVEQAHDAEHQRRYKQTGAQRASDRPMSVHRVLQPRRRPSAMRGLGAHLYRCDICRDAIFHASKAKRPGDRGQRDFPQIFVIGRDRTTGARAIADRNHKMDQ